MKGIVKWFNEKKGFGFISKEDGSGDIFVHFSSISGNGFKTLLEKDKVEFDIQDSEKGQKASNVIKIS